MKVVVDVGCKNWGEPDESVIKLIDRFKPDILFGFDPHPDLSEGITKVGDTVVIICNKAAWTSSGRTAFREDEIASHIRSGGELSCDTFNLKEFLRSLPECELVVKLDCEGAEYPLLADLMSDETHELIDTLLVEWHSKGNRPGLREWVENW